MTTDTPDKLANHDKLGQHLLWCMQLFIIVLLLALISPFSSAQEKPPADQSASLASVAGSVVQSDTGAPVANAQVIVTGPIPEGESAESNAEEMRRLGASTDEKGNFTFEKLKPGNYYVAAKHAGMIQKRSDEMGGMTVQLQSGHSQKITVSMLATGVIAGRVLNEQGEPMQSERVTAMQYRYWLAGRRLIEVKTVETNDQGEYRLFGLKPGSYLVLAASRGSGGDGWVMVKGESSSTASARTYAPAYYPNESMAQNAVPIVVKPRDEARANFSLAQVTAYKVSGKVLGLVPQSENKDGEEQRVRYVVLTQKGFMSPAGVTGVRKDSTFELPAIPSGRYTLTAVDSDRKDDERHGSREVVVDSSDVTGITVNLDSSKGQLNGLIRPDGESKLDLSKLYVIFLPADANSMTESNEVVMEGSSAGIGYGEVKRDGSFKAELPVTSGVVSAMVSAQSTGSEDWYTSKVLLNGKDVLASGFKAADAARGQIEIVISARGGTIEGTALTSENKPFVDAQIIAVPADPKMRTRLDLMQKVTADSQGRFRLRGVRPGEYLLMALEDAEEQPFADEPFLKQNSDKIQKIKVEASTQQVKLQTITMEK